MTRAHTDLQASKQARFQPPRPASPRLGSQPQPFLFSRFSSVGLSVFGLSPFFLFFGLGSWGGTTRLPPSYLASPCLCVHHTVHPAQPSLYLHKCDADPSDTLLVAERGRRGPTPSTSIFQTRGDRHFAQDLASSFATCYMTAKLIDYLFILHTIQYIYREHQPRTEPSERQATYRTTTCRRQQAKDGPVPPRE